MTNIIKKPIFYIILVAAVYRFVGIFYGFGHDFFSDASVHVAAAFKMLEERTINATFDFYYLPPLMSYILAPLFALWGALGILAGKFAGISDFREFVVLNKEYFVMGTRLISFLLGTASVYLIYLTVLRMFDRKTAIVTSLFLAFDFYHVHESQSGRIWAPLTFFIIAALYAVWRIFESELTNWRFFETEEPKHRWYLLGAVSIGLGYAIGYVPILMYPWFAAAHILKNKAVRIRDVYFDKKFLLANAIILFFIILFSYANTNAFLRQFGSTLYVVGVPLQENPALAITGESNFISSFGSALYFLFDDSPFFLIFGIIGAFLLAFKYRNSFFSSLLVGFPILYLAGISYGFPSLDARYVLPAVPFLLILSVFTIRELAGRLAAFSKQIFVVLTVLGVIYSFYLSTAYGLLLFRQDTRVQAINWIHQNIKPGSSLLLDLPFTYFRYENKESIRQLEKDGGFVNTRQKYLFNIPDKKYPSPSFFVLNEARRSHTQSELKNLKLEYAVYFFWNKAEGFYWRNKIPGHAELIKRFYPVRSLNYGNLAITDKSESGSALPHDLMVGASRTSNGVYPSEEIFDMHDFLNAPEGFWGVIPKLRFFGPYVEIYRVMQ
ncbi:MAG: hypothetical protein A3G49_02555 [Candidatus Sungbacteria bacterium RIFCSPLOWO2_12_FULL_41_11]|uniref:ArnT-like N-terminal domain-containing protein n=1 Tax=Candidatus Sungbacteria bacterium RIFCSPLOWO2_12_FULL_41_11 TaxID=1802286 RepID=A0A1G2LPW3_9BACT|nr:MAG: Protein with oligosaccharyl transferase-like protein [Parcubacteria group bacterium GW2011_GWA2_42_14]OHA13647.1 MAG: hypothetical protein A3G49_02555 [Candidatus Sungbacteria bacterium RIFCSPLOWO2_12_FULL_41_11]